MDKKNGDSKCIKLWYMKTNKDSLFNEYYESKWSKGQKKQTQKWYDKINYVNYIKLKLFQT